MSNEEIKELIHLVMDSGIAELELQRIIDRYVVGGERGSTL